MSHVETSESPPVGAVGRVPGISLSSVILAQCPGDRPNAARNPDGPRQQQDVPARLAHIFLGHSASTQGGLGLDQSQQPGDRRTFIVHGCNKLT